MSRGGSGKIRIIGGQWRGRRLAVPDLPGLRPTTDRNRETLFNWLAPEIVDRHCLDLFAGSGALGLEALSRGAASCVFVERQQKAVQQIQSHLQTLDARDRGRVNCEDALRFLQRQRSDPMADLVFVDPPFASDLLDRALEILLPQMASHAIVYVEHAVDRTPGSLDSWHCRRSKRSGGVTYALYEKA